MVLHTYTPPFLLNMIPITIPTPPHTRLTTLHARHNPNCVFTAPPHSIPTRSVIATTSHIPMPFLCSPAVPLRVRPAAQRSRSGVMFSYLRQRLFHIETPKARSCGSKAATAACAEIDIYISLATRAHLAVCDRVFVQKSVFAICGRRHTHTGLPRAQFEARRPKRASELQTPC
jgi:hypothetical protein